VLVRGAASWENATGTTEMSRVTARTRDKRDLDMGDPFSSEVYDCVSQQPVFHVQPRVFLLVFRKRGAFWDVRCAQLRENAASALKGIDTSARLTDTAQNTHDRLAGGF